MARAGSQASAEAAASTTYGTAMLLTRWRLTSIPRSPASAWDTPASGSRWTCIGMWSLACRRPRWLWLTTRWRRPYRGAPKLLGSSWVSNRGVATTRPSRHIKYLGHVAEWLRNGLQNRVPRFNSGRGLQINQLVGSSAAAPNERCRRGSRSAYRG